MSEASRAVPGEELDGRDAPYRAIPATYRERADPRMRCNPLIEALPEIKGDVLALGKALTNDIDPEMVARQRLLGTMDRRLLVNGLRHIWFVRDVHVEMALSILVLQLSLL